MTKLFVKDAGAWKEPHHMFVKDAGAWKDPLGGYVKDAGVWKQFYPQAPPTTLDLDFMTGVMDPRITFSRMGMATYFDSAGVMRYAGHNLVVQSQDFNTTWAKVNSATITVDATTAPDGTLTADRINHTVAGTVPGGGVNGAAFGVAPTAQILSIYAKAGTKNWLSFGTNINAGVSNAWFNLATGTLGTKGANIASHGMTSVGNGWYRCWIVCGTSSVSMYARVAEADNSFNCTSTGDIFAWGAQCEFVTTATTPSTYMPTTTAPVGAPRFDYDPITHQLLGLLIEENTIIANITTEDFTAWATKTGCTVTADQTAAPTSIVNADLITATASPALIATTMSRTTGATYIQSLFVKRGTSDWVYMIGQGGDATAYRAWFNLVAGTIGTVEAGISKTSMRNVGNGWWRISLTRLGTTGLETFAVGLCDADNSTAVTVGKTVYVWGAMAEQTDVSTADPSSYFPSGTAREDDVALMDGANFTSWHNPLAGTFVAEFDVIGLTTNGYVRGVVATDAGTGGSQAQLSVVDADPKANITLGHTPVDLGTVVAYTPAKIGLAYADLAFDACFNGGTVVNQTVVSMPVPVRLRIGGNVGLSFLNGHVRRIRYWNTKKSNAELQALTT